MKKYDHKKIEARWQKAWQDEKIYEPDLKKAEKPFGTTQGKPFYNLMMFPYPSGEGLHVGHAFAFTGADVYGRKKRMEGRDVFEPMGYDSFGIHAENYAIKINEHPKELTRKTTERYEAQLKSMGIGYAWDERLLTSDAEYYKWTQWIFMQMWKHGLAYRKKQAVNWCPSCKTVLADEQVILRGVKNDPEQMRGIGVCERCSSVVKKKNLEQWFFRITKYAEKLLQNLEKIDWSEKIKIAQRNWIGRSEGASIRFRIKYKVSSIKSSDEYIEVFTTRPDTLFGATYMVLAPEHELISNLKSKISNFKEVENYVKKARSKTEEERTVETKDKTGVELKGIKAINPTNNEEIPIFAADYVLSGYGTGAIMAVPAHDERDWEFAKKFDIEIRNVIDPVFSTFEGKTEERERVVALVEDGDKVLTINWGPGKGGRLLVGGGIQSSEGPVETAQREIAEEAGYTHVKLAEIGQETVHYKYFSHNKKAGFHAHVKILHFKLEKKERVAQKLEDNEKGWFVVEWISKEQAGREIIDPLHNYVFQKFIAGKCYAGTGIMANSGKFSGMDSEEAKWAITKLVGGERKIQYRLRDWLISRQRYWGAPIPMIFCDTCAAAGKGEYPSASGEMHGWYAVPEKDLPVELPFIKEFRPQGKNESPLASVKEFYETKCPACGAKARRETDVSDTFLDSAWYFLRYPSVHNEKEAWDKALTKKWLPVNMYIGGAEHAVLHLLYSRFVTMAFHDFGILDFEEPFSVFRAHGLLIKDGAKMSKSKGNVVNPDEYVKNFGADAFRMYLMFLAPFEQGGDFRDQGILGITRFLDRVWKMGMEVSEGKEIEKTNSETETLIHQTIKKVTGDIDGLQYNTAISALMVFLSGLEKDGANRENFEILLKLLASFAPHITEELWYELGNKTSIHTSAWPKFDAALALGDTIDFVIQVNGKHRGTINIRRGIGQDEAEKLARETEKVKTALAGKNVHKVVFVPDRLINFVVQ
ncbi:MAG: class I tRNA ligase family protein [Candidatus Jorgensenbacteria bacterium]|nr:class I tRNA ligase family protein [Candidatus Jorgensenbacteria bacterium]